MSVGPAYLSEYGVPAGTPDALVTSDAELVTALASASTLVEVTASFTLSSNITWADNITLFTRSAHTITLDATGVLQMSTGCSILGFNLTTSVGNDRVLQLDSASVQTDIVIAANAFTNAGQAIRLPAVAGAGNHGPVSILHNSFDDCSHTVFSLQVNNVTIDGNHSTNPTARHIEMEGGSGHVIRNNYLAGGDTGISLLLRSDITFRTGKDIVIEWNTVLDATDEGIGLDGFTSAGAQSGILDQFQVVSTGGSYNSSPTIRVPRTAVLNRTVDSWLVFATGTSDVSGKAFKINGSSTVDASNIDIEFDDDIFTSAEFSAIAADDYVTWGYIWKDTIIRNNYVRQSGGSCINVWGASNDTHIYGNLSIQTSPSASTTTPATSIKSACLAGIVASTKYSADNNTTTATIMTPAGGSLVRQNTAIGLLYMQGRTYEDVVVLAENPVYSSDVKNNAGDLSRLKWLSAVDDTFKGVEPYDNSTWATNTSEAGSGFIDASGEDYRLDGGSANVEGGTRWWGTDPPPVGIDGLRFSRKPAIGAYQPRPDDGATRSPLVLSAAAGVYDAGVDVAKVRPA